jgi:hypothetical protein
MATYKTPIIHSYAEAKAALGGQHRQHLGNHTMIESGLPYAPDAEELAISVYLHHHEIICFRPDCVLLNNQGYATPTTHDRFRKIAGKYIFNRARQPRYTDAAGTVQDFPSGEWVRFDYAR